MNRGFNIGITCGVFIVVIGMAVLVSMHRMTGMDGGDIILATGCSMIVTISLSGLIGHIIDVRRKRKSL